MERERAGDLQPGAARPQLIGWTALAVAAGLALAPVDYAIVAAAFLYRPLGGEIVLAVVAAVFLLGVGLRRPWLVYASQAVAIAPVLVAMARDPGEVRAGGVLLVGAATVAAVGLAWLVARALPGRSRG